MEPIELKITLLPIDKLIPYANNSRTHTDAQITKIASSIKEFGFNDPIAIDKDHGIIAGHGRVMAAKLLGYRAVPTIQLGHLTKEQQKAYILAHNRVALDAGWDTELLQLEMLELKNAGFDIELTGFDDKEIEALLNPETVTMGNQNDDALPFMGNDTVSKPGDVWILGNHRLCCGDSTNPLDVDKLCKEYKPNLMVTDPPYGVNYDPEWREGCDVQIAENISKGKVENDDEMDWSDAYSLFTGDIMYVWHSAIYSGDIALHIKNSEFDIVNQIIWVKQHFTLSRGDYHWQHEPCWYAVRKGKKHNWCGSRTQSTTWQISNNNSFGNSTPEKTYGHGTQKPIECMATPIRNNSKPKDYVYDPFGGSGTTLIACEKHDRKCLMMEISPKYCDMIIKRWQDYTGKEAILEADGSLFKVMTDGNKTNATS